MQPLSYFHDDYGLKPKDGEEDEAENLEEDEEVSGSEEEYTDDSDDSMAD